MKGAKGNGSTTFTPLSHHYHYHTTITITPLTPLKLNACPLNFFFAMTMIQWRIGNLQKVHVSVHVSVCMHRTCMYMYAYTPGPTYMYYTGCTYKYTLCDVCIHLRACKCSHTCTVHVHARTYSCVHTCILYLPACLKAADANAMYMYIYM